MTTVAKSQDRMERLEQIDTEVARAWTAYNERLRDLDGAEYADAEPGAWTELQDALGPLHGAREALLAAGAPDPHAE